MYTRLASIRTNFVESHYFTGQFIATFRQTQKNSVSKSQAGHGGSSGLSECGAAEVGIAASILSFADKTANGPD